MDKSTKLLIELRETYIYDLDPDGYPKASILDMVKLWQRVSNQISEI